jgi:hypothetical protein
MPPKTRRTFSHQVSNIHEILFPAWSLVESHCQTPGFIQVLLWVDAS